MTHAATTLVDEARAAFERRAGPVRSMGEAAESIARACHDMAVRFLGGGKILAFGNGGPTTDAQHISVEFVHPVIVGKRALPAISLNADAASVMGLERRHGTDGVYARQLDVLGADADIALGVSSDGNDANVLRGLERAQQRGLLTIALLGGDGGAIGASDVVDHLVVAASDEPHVVKEAHVTAYHVLWELVHVFLEQPSLLTGGASEHQAASGSVEALYPFLYEGSSDVAAVLDQVRSSTLAKIGEVVELRRAVGEEIAPALAAAADEMAASFTAGGKLLTCGNGGSSSDAQEVAQMHVDPDGADRPLPALCATNDVAVITALSNDVDFEVVFARQVRAFGRPGDMLMGLSTSGNSPNVLRAFEAAKDIGMLTVGLAGSDGGAMASSEAIDHLFVVPSSSVHRIQEVQTTIYHVLHELTQVSLRKADADVAAPQALAALLEDG